MADKFTQFEVTRVVRESEIITSFCLVPKTPLSRDFVPGEYLIFEHAFEGDIPMRREYSISGQDEHSIRVTIKHETAPAVGVPDGMMSSRFHKMVGVGDIVRAAGPMGKFTLDRASTRPVVLLSGGVGLTPMVAMAHDLVKTGNRATLFIHACENGRVHAMGAEMRGLAALHANFTNHFVYRTPEATDKLGTDYDTQGMVDRALLDTILPGTDCDFYLCGPGPFMQAMYDLLHDMGVATGRISYEFFGPASVLKTKAGGVPAAKPSISSDQPKITFAKSGVETHWDPDSENLLEFAEDNDVMVDFSCRAGTCDTCKTKVLSGSVSYPEEPFERPAEGYALLCCCLPDDDIVLDI